MVETTIIPRSFWGARYQAGRYYREPVDLAKYFHHSVTKHLPVDASVAEECAQMRNIEAIGQQRFGPDGWGGISYTHVGFPSGRIYEGAGIDRVSAHTGPGRNRGGAGFCFAGNYETNDLGPRAEAMAVAWLRHGVAVGWWRTPVLTGYHGQFKSTSCPGRGVITRIGAINLAASRTGGTSRDDERPPLDWTLPFPLTPQLVNQRLRLMGIQTRGRDQDYDREAVAEYQRGQVFPTMVADGLWGPVTEGHFNWVIALQKALARYGGKLAIDGFYGPHTGYTVGRFQAARGLFVDEKAGPITCAALGVRAHP